MNIILIIHLQNEKRDQIHQNKKKNSRKGDILIYFLLFIVRCNLVFNGVRGVNNGVRGGIQK